MIEETNTSWKQGTINGPNEKLLKIAKKLLEASKLSVGQKLSDLKRMANAEAKKIDHPEVYKAVEIINNIDFK